VTEGRALAGRTILITGADGMLGRAFQEALVRSVPECRVVALDRRTLDVTDRAAVLRQAAVRPDVIVHCAANVNADDCERHPDACRAVQVGGTEHVAELALGAGARVFYPQSVFIFDGGELPVTERTTPAPRSTYGRCKLEAERILIDRVPGTLVVRMAGFFGGDDKDKNFVGKLGRELTDAIASGRDHYAVGERVWQPTYTLDLAMNSLLLLALGRTGIYHMGAQGEATFFDVAAAYAEALGLASRIAIVKAPGERPDPGQTAFRPIRMVTATERLDCEGLNRQRHWRSALDEYLARPYFARFRLSAPTMG
jgi:dTDP-4-dehydrorhamnose reductase